MPDIESSDPESTDDEPPARPQSGSKSSVSRPLFYLTMDDGGALLVAALAVAHPAPTFTPFHSKVDDFVCTTHPESSNLEKTVKDLGVNDDGGLLVAALPVAHPALPLTLN